MVKQLQMTQRTYHVGSKNRQLLLACNGVITTPFTLRDAVLTVNGHHRLSPHRSEWMESIATVVNALW
jgi:hypothetical protein